MTTDTQAISTLRKQKKEVFEKLMQGDHILLHLDSNHNEVIVPVHLKGNPTLTLKLSYYFQGKTSHDDNTITTELVFSGRYFECLIPWDAIWAMTDEKQESYIWANINNISEEVEMKEKKPQPNLASVSFGSEEFVNNASSETKAYIDSAPISSPTPKDKASVNRQAVRQAVLRRIK